MNQSGEVFYVGRPICAAVHNISHVRQSIEKMADLLGASRLCQTLQQSNVDAGLVSQRTIDTLVENAIDNMDAKLQETIEKVVEKVRKHRRSISSLERETEKQLPNLYVSRVCFYALDRI